MKSSNDDILSPVPSQAPILFFDGVCGLCNGAVDWLLPRTSTWKFAPLQGETARANLTRDLIENLGTVVVLKDGKLFTHSSAVNEILKTMPGYRWLAGTLQLFPRAIRDSGYRAVAKIRYKIWGKRETCRIPSPEERARFLP